MAPLLLYRLVSSLTCHLTQITLSRTYPSTTTTISRCLSSLTSYPARVLLTLGRPIQPLASSPGSSPQDQGSLLGQCQHLACLQPTAGMKTKSALKRRCKDCFFVLRYQHGLSTPDLRQTLPNLKNFLEHGLLVRCDRHHVSSSIPVPTGAKSQFRVSAASEVGFPTDTSSPDRGSLRKRASSEADKQKYKASLPPSYNTAMAIDQPQGGLAPPSPSHKHMSSSLDASIDLAKTLEDQAQQTPAPGEGDGDGEVELVEEEQLPSTTTGGSDCPTPAQDTTVEEVEEVALTSQQHADHTMNGSVVPGDGLAGSATGLTVTMALNPELCCSVEQAEEVMGTEATCLGLGMGLGDGARLEDYPCIPVEHAVAVECDEQVLGELDAAGFEEFSRRIYALNENMSSFRRPRKNSSEK